jgi:tetratricopeptide (TPR) repeat protein
MKALPKILIFLLFFSPVLVKSQDASALIDEGKKLELKFKEDEAFDKYKQANDQKPSAELNVKLAELSCNKGGRVTDPLEKMRLYKEAQTYANAARWIDSTNGDVLYITAMVYDKLLEVEEKKEIIAEDIKLVKYFITKAISVNPANGRYYHLYGRWHYEMLNLNPVKKTAVKLLYGMPPASIDTAIDNMEKCKSMEPYYCLNFYDLGRAYNFNRQYEKAIAVLEQLQKLPTRKQDDPAIKKQGAVLLQQLN